MIPAELAERARRVLRGHHIAGGARRPGRPSALLTGLLICAGCGRRMVADSDSYKCQLRAQGGGCEARASAYRGAIEPYVVSRWLWRLENANIGDEMMVAVAQRWQALTNPRETAAVEEAVAAVRDAEAALDKFHADDRAGFYSGRSARYRMPAKVAAEERLAAAEARLAQLSVGPVDVSFLLGGDGRDAWEAAGPELRRDLLALAIDYVTVSKAPRRGAPFDGDARCTIGWATP